jgi:ABC-type multidrug transport system permease subunit
MRPSRLQLEIPITTTLQGDIVAKQKELNSDNSSESLKWFFRILNEWMWMLLMLVLFVAVIYAWYTLITSVGDSDKMKTGLRMLLYIVFWLVIALLSWALISLVAWMFA